MIFNLRLFSKVWQKLTQKISLSRKSISDYSIFINSEYSLARLTSDSFGNHYFRDPSSISIRDGIGLASDVIKTRSR